MKTKEKAVKSWKGDIKVYVTELKPYLYLIDENHAATGYLIIGEEKACLIDTMQGYHNLKETVDEITDKPVVVINTHGHIDHIFGNVFFDKAYMNERDSIIAKEHMDKPAFGEVIKFFGQEMPPFENIKEGDTIDLGGKTLEVFELPGHTPGEIVVLLKEDRILFTGDAINHNVWLQVPYSLSLKSCVKSLDRIMFLEERADYILHGHSRGYDDISLMRNMREGIQEVLDGKTRKDEDYPWFEGVDRVHYYKASEGKQYTSDIHAVIYRENNIK